MTHIDKREKAAAQAGSRTSVAISTLAQNDYKKNRANLANGLCSLKIVAAC